MNTHVYLMALFASATTYRVRCWSMCDGSALASNIDRDKDSSLAEITLVSYSTSPEKRRANIYHDPCSVTKTKHPRV